MDKLLTFPGKSERGIFTYVIDTESAFLEKTAAEYHPEIASYINSAKSIPGKTQILLTALGAGEWWGCFLEGTPISMADGTTKPIEMIEKGDLVQTHISKNHEVLEPIARYYDGNVFKFHFKSWGSDLTCTEEHPIYGIKAESLAEARKLYYRQKESYDEFVSRIDYSFISAKNLSLNDYVCVAFPTDESGQIVLPQENLAYIFGRYLADGCLVNRYNRPGIAIDEVVMVIGEKKSEDIERIKEVLESYGHKCLVQKTEGDASRLSFHWADFAGTCLYHMGRGAKTKFVSSDFMRMPRSWQKEFLRGYLSGDGCQTLAEGRYYGSIRSSTVSEAVASSLCKMVARLGYSSSFFKCKQHETCALSAGNTIYENTYERNFSQELGGRFVAVNKGNTTGCSYIDEKRGFILVPIKEMYSDKFKGTVYNLSVETENSYCVSHGFAVHNCNRNGDYFPELALAHQGPDYGYQTFKLYAKIYKHHVNKDPSASYGDVVISVYNANYHRVELIVLLDNAKAPDIVQSIENGDYPEWSMGTRVPFDVCSICGNKAPTRKHYCEHLKYYMGRIHPPTGKMVYAVNTMPKFFDISHVLIGADKIAKTLKKVASFSTSVGSACNAEKHADIKKEIPAEDPPASQDELLQAIPEVKAREPSLPKPMLDTMGKHDLSKVFSTMAMLGIAPKPQEFQRIVLISIGKKNIADDLDSRNECFDPMITPEARPIHHKALHINGNLFDDGIFKMLRPHMEDRSYAAPHLLKRIVVMTKRAFPETIPVFIKTADEARKPVGIFPLLAIIAGMYAAFSKKAPAEAVGKFDKLIRSKPFLLPAIAASVPIIFNRTAGTGTIQPTVPEMYPDSSNIAKRIEEQRAAPFLKTGSVGAFARRAFVGVPAVYMLSGMLQKHRRANPMDREGRIKRFVRQYPDLVGAAVAIDAMMALKGRGTHRLTKNVSNIFKKFGSVSDFVSHSLVWPLAYGPVNAPMRMLGGAADYFIFEGSRKLLSNKKGKNKINYGRV